MGQQRLILFVLLCALLPRIRRLFGILRNRPRFPKLRQPRYSVLGAKSLNTTPSDSPFFCCFCNRNVIHNSHSIKAKTGQPHGMAILLGTANIATKGNKTCNACHPIARFFVTSNILSILYTIWRTIAICRIMNEDIFSCRFWPTIAKKRDAPYFFVYCPAAFEVLCPQRNPCITIPSELQCDQAEMQKRFPS